MNFVKREVLESNHISKYDREKQDQNKYLYKDE